MKRGDGVGGSDYRLTFPFFLQYKIPGQVGPPQGQGLRRGPFAPSCALSGVRAGIQRGGEGAWVLVAGRARGQGRWPGGSHDQTQLHVPARTIVMLIVMDEHNNEDYNNNSRK